MNKGTQQVLMVRALSVGFAVLALGVFKPFGLWAWHAEAMLHLFIIWVVGMFVCMLTEGILKYVVMMPQSSANGVGYVIRRNLWFQLINTPLVSLAICLYRHFVLSGRVASNRLSWGNFMETLLIFAFCSFAIGLYWRFKFRSSYLAQELEETRLLNKQLMALQQKVKEETAAMKAMAAVRNGADDGADGEEQSVQRVAITLKGTTSDAVTLYTDDLLYVEAVGNYVRVHHLRNGEPVVNMLRATSKQMEDALHERAMIVRCHRAFLVNLKQVERFESKAGRMQLFMRHCTEPIPVSRSNMSQIKVALQKEL